MTDDANSLDDLLARMPEIAKAVSVFPEGVQQSVLDALMAAAGASIAPVQQQAAASDPDGGVTRTKSPRRKRRTGKDADGAKSRRVISVQPKVVKDLDLRPKGKKSFAEFASDKNPTSNHDRTAVALYYLANEANINPVTRDHVFTAYREMGWKIPTDFANSLQQTATKKRFLDTSDAEDLRLLTPGLNRVEHDLPEQKKS
jgi:hypothetical protein